MNKNKHIQMWHQRKDLAGRMIAGLSLWFYLFGLAPVSLAQSPEFAHSSFGTGDESLEYNISFPEVSGDIDLSIRCAAWISLGGQYDVNWCFPSDLERERDFIRSIHRATVSAINTPAIYEGEPIRVYFTYHVRFTRTGDEAGSIRVYPNDGVDREKYGEDHYGPQVAELNRIFPNLDPLNCFTNSNRTKLLTITARVGAKAGLALETGVENAFRCRTAWQDFAEHKLYIPAYADTGYVESSISQQYWQPTEVSRRIVHPRDQRAATLPLPTYTNPNRNVRRPVRIRVN